MKQTIKSVHLPKPIAAYFQADKLDGEAVSRCFTKNARVKDEGHTYNGQSAIKAWKTDVSKKNQYESEPLSCEQKDGKIVVTSRVTGNFPGSPLDLRFSFALEGDKIESLEIIP